MNAEQTKRSESGGMNEGTRPHMPPLRELGDDLITITLAQRVVAVTIPFFCVAAYFAFAVTEWWPAALVALMALSFFTYGSTSHDLVHRNLGLPSKVNDLLLSLIELLCLRSGHAYRIAHLHHHARFPHEDDMEGSAARMSFSRTLLEGPIFQFRIWFWALNRAKQERVWILWEGVGCLLLFAAAAAVCPITPIFFIYTVIVIMGGWLFPLITAHLPHDPDRGEVLCQTRVFRGVVLSVIALDHLYHLEHHLYPSVPHQKWRQLANRLHPYFAKAGVQPIKLWF